MPMSIKATTGQTNVRLSLFKFIYAAVQVAEDLGWAGARDCSNPLDREFWFL